MIFIFSWNMITIYFLEKVYMIGVTENVQLQKIEKDLRYKRSHGKNDNFFSRDYMNYIV